MKAKHRKKSKGGPEASGSGAKAVDLKKERRQIRLLVTLAVLMLVAGVSVYLFPTVSDLWNRYRNAQLVDYYETQLGQLPDKEYERIWAEAEVFNREHKQNTIVDAFSEGEEYRLTAPYDQLLNPAGNNVMGSIHIPKINVHLAIYHGIGEDVLQEGVGHIEGTSLPIGGIGSHSVLSAHRGLPSAKLFTDLDRMVIGDKFYLKIMDHTLAYQIDQILTVLPSETQALDIDPDKDYCTLLTCTPYGVNTHRLLLRGVRVPYVPEQATRPIDQPSPGLKILDFIMGNVGITLTSIPVILIIVIVWRRRKRRKKEAEKEAQDDVQNEAQDGAQSKAQNEAQKDSRD